MAPFLLLLSFLFLLAPASDVPAATTLANHLAGVGEGEGARLEMLFEVTFLSIDVARVEAFLPPATARQVTEAARRERKSGGLENELRPLLLAADPVVLRMSFLRDAGWNRFLDGTRSNLEAATDAGILRAEELERLWPAMERAFAPLAARGVRRGDAVSYRVEASRVHTAYFGPAGELLLEFRQEGDAEARGARGAFFAPGSAFARGLAASARRR